MYLPYPSLQLTRYIKEARKLEELKTSITAKQLFGIKNLTFFRHDNKALNVLLY